MKALSNVYFRHVRLYEYLMTMYQQQSNNQERLQYNASHDVRITRKEEEGRGRFCWLVWREIRLTLG